MDMVEAPFDVTVFTKNRERLLRHDVAGRFFHALVERARGEQLLSAEHFTVDGTLIEAWASMKSFKRKDSSNDEPPKDDPGNPTADFHGEKRGNQTHESTTDPEARLARKSYGKEAKLCYSAHALMENRNGLLVDFRVAEANGTAERDVGITMIGERIVSGGAKAGAITLGADKGYDTRDFVADCRTIGVVPHVAQNAQARRRSAIDHRTTRHAGYSISQRLRKRVEEIFGWCKTVGNFRKTRVRGKERTQMAAYFVGAAYNLLRVARMLTPKARVNAATRPSGAADPGLRARATDRLKDAIAADSSHRLR